VWHVVVKDRVYFCVYDEFHRCVVTFLTKDHDVVRQFCARMDML